MPISLILLALLGAATAAAVAWTVAAERRASDLQRTLAACLNQANNQLILAPRLENGEHSEDLHPLPVGQLQPVQDRRRAAEEHARKLAEIVLEGEVLVPGGLPAIVGNLPLDPGVANPALEQFSHPPR